MKNETIFFLFHEVQHFNFKQTINYCKKITQNHLLLKKRSLNFVTNAHLSICDVYEYSISTIPHGPFILSHLFASEHSSSILPNFIRCHSFHCITCIANQKKEFSLHYFYTKISWITYLYSV